MNRTTVGLALAAFFIPTITLAAPEHFTDVKTPYGTLQYTPGFGGNGSVVKFGNSVIFSSQYLYASAGKPINTASGSAILMTYRTGGNSRCNKRFEWISILPGGRVTHTDTFGKCYYVSEVHPEGSNAIAFKMTNVHGKGFKTMSYTVSSGTLNQVAGHMVSANAPKVVVNHWRDYVPVYGTISPGSAGAINSKYKLQFPQKTEITGSGVVAGNGKIYVSSISIEKLSVPQSDIGKPMHFMAKITCPAVGPYITDIRP